MDTLTQIALGACIGQAIGYRKFGAKALVFGGVGGLIPDLDVLMTPFLGEYGSWKYHRHVTHALWFGPLLGIFMGWGLWKHYGRQFGHLYPWVLIMILSLLTHPLLDLFTIYGTQLLAPFSSRRFEISGVSIIDPIYTLTLVLAMLVIAVPKFRKKTQFCAYIALALTTAYLFFGWYLNEKAEQIAAAQLQSRNVSYKKIEAFTTIFQPFLRRILVTEEHGIRVGFVSTFEPEEIFWSCRTDIHQDVKSAIVQTENAKVFNWFSIDHLGFAKGQNENEYIASDLRYGIPGESVFGWWGQSYQVARKPDGSGYLARYTGKTRYERDSSWSNIKQLFRAAYGLPNTFLPKKDTGLCATR